MDDQRNRHNRDKQSPRYSRRIPHLAVFKGILEYQHGHGPGGVHRTSVGQDIGLIEQLEGVDDADYEVEENGGGAEGDGDGKDLPERGGAIDFSAFIIGLGDILNTGKHNQDIIADGSEVHQNDAHQSGILIP